MKSIIKDDAVVNRFHEQIYFWVKEQTKGQLDDLDKMMTINEIVEYPVYRVACTVGAQSRTIIPFTRPDRTVVQSPPTVLAPEQVDAWSLPFTLPDTFTTAKEHLDIPQSLKGTPCKTCRGAGTLPCPDCQGRTEIVCHDCHGDGRVPCPECKRTMKITCTKCRGHGRIYNDINRTFEVCTYCRGAGMFKCTNCTSGYVLCGVCKGKGHMSCERCGQKGSRPCEECAGQGQFLSGLGVEMILRIFDDKTDVPNTDIPDPVLRSVGPLGTFKVAVAAEGEKVDAGILEEKGMPVDVQLAYKRIREKMPVAASSRVVRQRLVIEKKTLYLLNYKIGDKQDVVWAAENDGRIMFEKKLMADIFDDVLGEIRRCVASNDFSGARILRNTIGKIEALTSEIAAVDASIRRKLLVYSLTGVALGVGASAALLIPSLYHWRAHSLHFNHLLAQSVFLILGTGTAAGIVFSMLPPRVLGGMTRRFIAGFASVSVVIGCAVAGARVMNYDPAREYDLNQMKNEYRRQFPEGLRTLARTEDIVFLEELIGKYEPVGLDVSRYKSEVEQLKAKQQVDAENLRKVEQARIEMENARKHAQDIQLRFRKKKRIYVR